MFAANTQRKSARRMVDHDTKDADERQSEGWRTVRRNCVRWLAILKRHPLFLILGALGASVILLGDFVEKGTALWTRFGPSRTAEEKALAHAQARSLIQEKVDASARFIRRAAIEQILGEAIALREDDVGRVFATYSLGDEGEMRHVYEDGTSSAFSVSTLRTDWRPAVQLNKLMLTLNKDTVDPILESRDSARAHFDSNPKFARYYECVYGGLESSYAMVLKGSYDDRLHLLAPDPFGKHNTLSARERVEYRDKLMGTIPLQVAGFLNAPIEPGPEEVVLDFLTFPNWVRR